MNYKIQVKPCSLNNDTFKQSHGRQAYKAPRCLTGVCQTEVDVVRDTIIYNASKLFDKERDERYTVRITGTGVGRVRRPAFPLLSASFGSK